MTHYVTSQLYRGENQHKKRRTTSG
jgi:hypothetical protein